MKSKLLLCIAICLSIALFGCSSIYVIQDRESNLFIYSTGELYLKNQEFVIDKKTKKSVPTVEKNIISVAWQSKVGVIFQAGVVGIVEIDSLIIYTSEQKKVLKKTKDPNYTIHRYIKGGSVAHSLTNFDMELDFLKEIAFSEGVILQLFLTKRGEKLRSVSYLDRGDFNKLQKVVKRAKRNILRGI